MHGISIASYAAIHHLQPNNFAFGTAAGHNGEQCVAPDELPFIELQEAIEACFKGIDFL
jgi:hypothetical protein